MTWFFVGILVGGLISIPVARAASRRTAERVRDLEQRASQAERLAEVSQLTSGLAHEIKNPLSTLGLNLQLLQEMVGDLDLPETESGRLSRRLEALGGETDRLKNILEDFLRFAGRMELDLQPTNVNQVVEQLVDFYTAQAAASEVHLRTTLDSAAGEVKVGIDKSLFKQSLLNLIINATQAMVRVRYTEQPHGGAKDLFLKTRCDNARVSIHVTDTGPGIEKETLEKVFHPYFSTKRGGMGLGLAITRRIIEEHGGTITVHSDVGQGTEFEIQLPVMNEGAGIIKDEHLATGD